MDALKFDYATNFNLEFSRMNGMCLFQDRQTENSVQNNSLLEMHFIENPMKKMKVETGFSDGVSNFHDSSLFHLDSHFLFTPHQSFQPGSVQRFCPGFHQNRAFQYPAVPIPLDIAKQVPTLKKPPQSIPPMSSEVGSRPTTDFKARKCPSSGRRGPRGKSNYRGVCITREGKWRSVIYKDRKQVYLGVYDSELEAAHAYDRASREYFGENANLNLPEEYPPRDSNPPAHPASKAEKNPAKKCAQTSRSILPVTPKVLSGAPPPTTNVAIEPHYDSASFEAQLFDTADNILLHLNDGPIVDSEFGPMSPIPSLFEGDWNEMCFV